MADILTVTKREATGSQAMRRLRAENMTPCVYYESGKESISLSVPTKELNLVIRHESVQVELKGDLSQQARIKDLQWDALGASVVHFDLVPV